MGNRPYLFQLLRHPGFNRRLVIAVFNLVEGRRVKRQCAGRIKRVVGIEAGRSRGCGGCAERDGTGGSDGVMNAWPHVLSARGGYLAFPATRPDLLIVD